MSNANRKNNKIYNAKIDKIKFLIDSKDRKMNIHFLLSTIV